MNGTHELKKKLDEMLEYTDLAQHTADLADRLNAQNRYIIYTFTEEDLEKITSEMQILFVYSKILQRP